MPASSISGPLPLAVKLTEQPKSPNLQTPALVTFTYQVKTLVGAKIKQARLFFTHQNITGLDVQMNHLTLMAMLQSTGDLHRYASSAIDLFVLRSQCLLTWSRKIKLFEPSEGIFRDPTKYWTTKKICKIGPLGPKEKIDFFSFFLMRKRLSSGQKWFLRPYFPLIRGMFVFRSGLRFSFRALEVPKPRLRKRPY